MTLRNRTSDHLFSLDAAKFPESHTKLSVEIDGLVLPGNLLVW